MRDRQQDRRSAGDDLPSADAFADWGDEEPFDDMADFALDGDPESDGAAEPPEESEAAESAATEPSVRRIVPPKGRASHPARTAFLIGFAVIIASTALGYSVLTFLRGTPAQLLDFDGLTSGFENILDIARYPANLFWLVAAAVVLLALATAAASSRAVSWQRRRAEVAEARLKRVVALRLEDESAWQDPDLQADPGLRDFTADVLGSYRLIQAKLTRFIGQEGELHRLEKAIVNNSRRDLSATYESPAVAALADEVTRLFDRSLSSEEVRGQLEEKLAQQGETLAAKLAEACRWNEQVVEQIQQQGAALERVAVKVKKMTDTVLQLSSGDGGVERPRMVEELRKLAALIPEESGSVQSSAKGLAEYVDRGSKLAFQIAMEVARLGPRGERLLPMTQELEELTTEFRKLAGQLETGAEVQDRLAAALRNIDRKIEKYGADESGATEAAGQLKQVAEQARDAAPLARQTADKLVEVARNFVAQTARLAEAGELSAKLTGSRFQYTLTNPDGTTGTASDLPVERFDPFGSSETPTRESELDPFASTPESIMEDRDADDGESENPAPASQVPDIAKAFDETLSSGEETQELEVAFDPFAGSEESTPSPDVEQPEATPAQPEPTVAEKPPVAPEPAETPEIDPTAAADAVLKEFLPDESVAAGAAESTSEPAATGADAATPRRPSGVDDLDLTLEEAQPGLSDTTDRVYDLGEFGAVPLETSESGESPDAEDGNDEPIYDLREFGARVVQ